MGGYETHFQRGGESRDVVNKQLMEREVKTYHVLEFCTCISR